MIDDLKFTFQETKGFILKEIIITRKKKNKKISRV